jgi:hypothetical protein
MANRAGDNGFLGELEPSPSSSVTAAPDRRLLALLRQWLAVLAGFGLYHVAIVRVGRHSAALPIPPGWIGFFGPQRIEWALALHSLLFWALPAAVIVCGGVLAIHRGLSTGAPKILACSLLGLLTGFAYWSVVSDLPRQDTVGGLVAAAWHQLRFSLTIPWWAAHNFAAPWLGFCWAAWLLRVPGPGRYQR